MLLIDLPIRTRLAIPLSVMAGPTLSADTNTIANLDACRHLRANSHSLSYDFVANTNRIVSWALFDNKLTIASRYKQCMTYPSRPQSMKVTGAHTTMGDFNIDISLLPCFRLVALPDHLAIDTVFIKTEPALETVILRHIVWC